MSTAEKHIHRSNWARTSFSTLLLCNLTLKAIEILGYAKRRPVTRSIQQFTCGKDQNDNRLLANINVVGNEKLQGPQFHVIKQAIDNRSKLQYRNFSTRTRNNSALAAILRNGGILVWNDEITYEIEY